MKRFFWIISLVTMSFAVLFQSVFAAYIYEKNTTAQSSANFVNGTTYEAQTFTATSNHTVYQIELYAGSIYVDNNALFTIELYNTSGGQPSTSTGSYAQAYLTSLTYVNDAYNGQYEPFVLNVAYDIVSGTKYAIVMKCDSCDVNNRPYFLTDNNISDTYSGGGRYQSTNSGSTWPSSYPNDDFLFKIDGFNEPDIDVIGVTQSYSGGYVAEISANVTNDGGNDVGFAFFWRNYTQNPTGSYNYRTVIGSYESGDTVSTSLINLIEGDTYQYYWYYDNTYVTGNTTGNFTVTEAVVNPEITPSYSLLGSISNPLAYLTGVVNVRGGSNVTANFLWRPVGGASWNSTATHSNLGTLDSYTDTLSGLTFNTDYEFKCQGYNDTNSSNSTTLQFTFVAATQPDVDTLTATNVTSNSAVLRGQVNDIGNDSNLESWFEIKQSSSTTWQKLTSQTLSTTGIYTYSISGLSANTSYDYRAAVEAHVFVGDELQDYGENRSFTTLPTFSVPIMITDNATYAGHTTSVLLHGTVAYDGGYDVTGYFQYRLETNISYDTWPLTSSGLQTGDKFFKQLTVLPNKWYIFKACGSNVLGSYCGNEVKFRLSDGSVETEDGSTGETTDTITTFEDIVNNARESLHLTGVMGTWAFMGLILLIIALIFGTVAFVADGTARTAIMVIWMFISISVVGAFIFTNQLSIWPILILVGAVTILVMIFVSVKLSGGGSNVNG